MMNKIPVYETVIPGVTVTKLSAPLFAQFELTEACQEKCWFCYNVWKLQKQNLKAKFLSNDQTELILQKLVDCRIFSIIFSGGEPTLHPNLPKLIEVASSSSIETSVISNGIKLTTEYMERLASAGLHDIQISLHHSEEAKADAIVGRPGSFRETLSGISSAIEVMGTQSVNINMVVTRDTITEIEPLGRFLKKLGVTSFSASLVSFCGMAAKNNAILTKSDFEVAYGHMQNLSETEDLSVSTTGGLPLCIVPGDWADGPVEISNICDAGIHQIVVGPDGGLRPCVQSSTIVGNVLTDDISKVWQNSDVMTKIRMFENVPPSCRTCKLVSDCHGGCRESALMFTGDYLGIDPMMEN